MVINEETQRLLEYLRQVAEQVSRSKYGHPQKIFELARTGLYPDYIVELAESFGMMIVKVEAREFRLEKNLRKLTKTNVLLQEEIKERNAIENTLRDNEAKYKAIFENSLDGICVIQGNKIKICNSQTNKIMGHRSRKQTLDRDIQDFIHPSDWPEIERLIDAVIAGKKTSDHVNCRFIKADQNPLYTELLIHRISYNEKAAVLCTIRDISEQLVLEQELRRSQKLESIGRLTGGIAHDFNNILAVINGYTELILNEYNQDLPYRSYVEEIDSAGKQATTLVRQLLAFSKKQVTKPEIIQINDKITELMHLLRHLIGEDIRVVLSLSLNNIYIKADAGQIEQVLTNLILNARDAINLKRDTGSERMIRIETSLVPLDMTFTEVSMSDAGQFHLKISVIDSGTGIPIDIQEKIFDPFFTTKENQVSVGLGLSTIYGIVKQNQGNIKVSSEPGHLTRFDIYWPVHNPKTAEIATHPSHFTSLFGKETILLVEDQGNIRKVLSIMLGSLGYKVISANSAEEAIRITDNSETNIDLLFTDIVLPAMNGRKLAEQMRKQFPAIKILLTSGYYDLLLDETRPEDIHYINKPFTKTVLAQKLREILA